MRKCLAIALTTALAIGVTTPAEATVTTLTFEGIPNGAPVGSYYAPDYVFSPATLAIIDSDAGGTGNFANEPSSDTVMYFLDTNSAILDVTNGFTTGFSFFYSSFSNVTIDVYSGVGGTGSILASLFLTGQYADNCTGDPNGQFCNWTLIGVAFTGTAYSINFGGSANQTGFDNITFGSETPGNGAVPEPATWASMMLGFLLVGTAMQRRRRRSLRGMSGAPALT